MAENGCHPPLLFLYGWITTFCPMSHGDFYLLRASSVGGVPSVTGSSFHQFTEGSGCATQGLSEPFTGDIGHAMVLDLRITVLL